MHSFYGFVLLFETNTVFVSWHLWLSPMGSVGWSN